MDVSISAIQNRLAAFRRHCSDRGLSLTPQRFAIYQVLAGDDSHPSAEEIFRRLKPQLLSLSLGTVYRTLELFEEHGLISRVEVLGDQARFDANQEDHAHLICVRCRRVTDMHDEQILSAPLPKKTLGGFQVLARRVHFLGICTACQAPA